MDSWTFETYDPTAPTVIETTPVAGAIDVEPDTVVQVIFDRPLLVGGQATTFALEASMDPGRRTPRGMNTAGRSQAFVGLDLRPRRALSTPREWATSPSRAMGTSTAGGDDTLRERRGWEPGAADGTGWEPAGLRRGAL
jgi:hypothetical protein